MATDTKVAQIQKEIASMLKNIIEVSYNDWRSTILMVPKPDGMKRLCVGQAKLQESWLDLLSYDPIVSHTYYLANASCLVSGIGNIFCNSTLFSFLCVTVNLVSILILSRGKCRLSTCTTRYLVAMATADLLVIITEVILNRIDDYYFPLNFLKITPVCSVRYVLLRIAIACSVWFTVAFTFDRFVAICCQKLKSKYCTKRTAAVVLAIIGILFTVKNIPIYFRFKPRWIIDNVPWMCSNKRSYFTDPVWIGFRKFEKVLTPLIPFGLILLLNVLTVRHILVTSRVREQLRGQSVGDNHSDPEMESRRKSMILLFSISGSFILLWFVYVLYFFDVNDFLDDDSFYIFKNVAYMLRNLSCCTNTLIYVLTQSNFREQLKSMLKYPVISIIKLINKQHT
ncbi:probable G-protein coupled receptor 139 [Scyliorhinus torazame]|uniref:probable G-protein coupled receptor 139 n=1 Tax=Scyliorhinus torazame TaxID=75743 RepID=UPI003B58C77E